MTEYGRGQGSHPWDPDDPLYGDQEWGGAERPGHQDGWQQPQQQHTGHPQHIEQQQPQQHHHPYQQQYDGGWHTGGQATQAVPGAQQQYGHAPYDTGAQQQYGHGVDPYGTGDYPSGEYATGEYATGQHHAGNYGTGEYPVGDYGTGEYPVGQQGAGQYGTGEYPVGEYPTGEYATGRHPAGDYGTGEYPVGEYPTGEYPAGEYGTGEYPAGGYHGGPAQGTGEHPAPYARQEHPAPGAYQQPQQPGAPVPDPRQEPGPGADPETGWDPGPDQGERAFFLDRDDDRAEEEDDPYEDDADGARRRDRRGGPAARRGRGCGLVISAALVAGVGVVGYVGYGFYQSHFASSPDYEGEGTGNVMVDIPDHASLGEMARVLHKAGVVKSPGAFVEAADDNQKSRSIQPGTYILRKRMSGASAVAMMLDPSSQNGIIIAEGWRASRIYDEIDKKLEVPEGTTKKAATSGDIGLPKWAHGEPEGFLFPSKYSVGEKSKPEDVLRKMVQRAEAEYAKAGLEDAAKKLDKTPEQIITIASLVQAEAQEDHEFGKVARVVYNRLDKDMALGFDSTINYAMGRSTLDVSVADTKYPSPYNTYLHKGLPPGPIGNPGHQAIEAALKPTPGDWLYFVTVKPGDTRFTDSASEHQKNVEDFNTEQRKKKGNGG